MSGAPDRSAQAERGGRRIVLFDVMDTLVRDPFRNDMPRFFGMSLAEMMAAKHPRAWIEFELSAWDEARFLENFFADGRAFDHAGFRECVFSGYELLPGVEEILTRLRAGSVELHTASNYPCWWREIEARTRLSRFVAWTFVSSELGARKPDARFFEAMTERLGASPGECVFVDDQPRNCDAARALGFDAVLFEGAPQLRDALAKRGLLDQ